MMEKDEEDGHEQDRGDDIIEAQEHQLEGVDGAANVDGGDGNVADSRLLQCEVCPALYPGNHRRSCHQIPPLPELSKLYGRIVSETKEQNSFAWWHGE